MTVLRKLVIQFIANNLYIYISLGAIISFLLLTTTYSSDKWVQALVVAAGLLCVIAITKMSQRILFIGLAVMLVFNIDIFLFYQYFQSISELHGVPGLQVSGFYITLSLLYLRWILKRHPNPRINVSIITLIALFIIICISNLFAFNRTVSVLETYRVFMIVFMSYYLCSNITDRNMIVLLSCTLIATIPIETIIAACQYFGLFTSSSSIFGDSGVVTHEMGYAEVMRPSGTFSHPDKFAIYLTQVIPLSTASLLVTRKFLPRIYALIVFLSGMLALVMSLARAAWIGVACGLCVLFFLLWRLTIVRRKMLIIYSAITVIVAISAPIVILPRFLKSDMGSAQSRIPMAINAIAVIKTYPFLGVGPNNYPLESWRYAPEDLSTALVGWPVHNFYLLIGAECGLIALVIFLLFSAIVIRSGIKKSVHSDLEVSAIKYGMTSGIFGFLVANSFNGHYMGEEVLFFFICQLIIACDSLVPEQYLKDQPQKYLI